jgi:type IX secretion system PorP/SprF family membrane protein
LNFKKFFSGTVFLFGILLAAYGQDVPTFTQYKNTMTYNNPGFMGMGDGICVNGLLRQQWAGFTDSQGNKVAPETYLVTINSPMKFLHGGLGGSIIQDKLGFEKQVGINLSYSFHASLSFADIGIGAGVSLMNHSIDFSKLKPEQQGDPILLSSEMGAMIFDGNLGIFVKTEDYYLGLSVINLLESHGKNLSTTDNNVVRYKTDRTLFLTGMYRIFLNNQDYEIDPGFMIESNLASTQYIISTDVRYKDRFYAGISYRFLESVGVMVGVKFRDFNISYSYDVSTMKYGMPGSHEIGLSYCFKIKGDNSKTSYKNTRYL